MTVESVSLFLALLAVAAQVGVVVALIGLLSRRGRSAVGRVAGRSAAGLAATVAAVSTAGSLYFSEIADFMPCNLCWYQRICMYPLVVLLGIAAVRRDRTLHLPVAILATVGLLVAGYHVLIERYPTLESEVCDPNNPCSLKWVEELGYVTIPTMALSGFGAILTLLALSHLALRRTHP